VPYIYRRFDIVWPKDTSEPSKIDALTYGLATLTKASEIFGETPGALTQAEGNNATTIVKRARGRFRRGNNYAHFVRKFSIGYGPHGFVMEYMKQETYKMLGTLVSLAVPRMRVLDSFIWDFPVIVIGDVWESLACLEEISPEGKCILDTVWLRFHQNNEIHPKPTTTGRTLNIINQSKALERVIHPSLSLCPPVKSLTVLDIDELQYVDEMAALIGKNPEKLRELRVGICECSVKDDWAAVWHGGASNQIDKKDPTKSSQTIGGKRRGGILGILVGMFFDLKKLDTETVPAAEPASAVQHDTEEQEENSQASEDDQAIAAAVTEGLEEVTDVPSTAAAKSSDEEAETNPVVPSTDGTPVPSVEVPPTVDNGLVHTVDIDQPPRITTLAINTRIAHPNNLVPQISMQSPGGHIMPADKVESKKADSGQTRLALTTLALEKVKLSVLVLQHAFDWTRLTSLTLLDCVNYDQLWNMLWTEFKSDITTPGPRTPRPGKSRRSINPYKPSSRLRLTEIRTNTVSHAMVRFLNECLLPDTLESVCLQHHMASIPDIKGEVLFNVIVKRHRDSLKKLSIDSSRHKGSREDERRSKQWKCWAFSAEQLRFITSGKVPKLTDLCCSIEHEKNWQAFYRALPNIPKLKTLYVPQYCSHYTLDPPPRFLAKDLEAARTFNKDMQLTFVALSDKCYEIEEDTRPKAEREDEEDIADRVSSAASDDDASDNDSDDDGGLGDDDTTATATAIRDQGAGVVDEEDTPTGTAAATGSGNADANDSDVSEKFEYDYSASESEDEDETPVKREYRPTYRSKDIYFYDEEIEIFKYRHGRI